MELAVSAIFVVGSSLMRPLAAAAVHLVTASGAALALLAFVAAAEHDWNAMFIWLGIALAVDAADGPLARWVGVEAALPRWSGERLDLMVDFLTYVAVPAFALSQAELLPEAARLPLAIAIVLSSLFHMSDLKSKTDAGFFVGFPVTWNLVLLYLFVFMPAPQIAVLILLLFILLTFVPIPYVHPIRVAELRPLTLLVTIAWAAAALWAVLHPFPSALWVKALLLGSAVYFAGIGVSRFWRDRASSNSEL